MNFAELLLNSYQYDIKEAVDNSVQKLKDQRRKQREIELKNKEARKREQSLERYRKARSQYQLKQDELRDLQQKKVTPSFKEKLGTSVEKAGEKLQNVDVTDPVALGRGLAKGVGNLPTYLAGKGLSKLGRKISGSEISKSEYEKQKRDIYRQEADARLKMDRAERAAMVRKRIPNPQTELEKKDIKRQQKEKQELDKTAKKMGTERLSAAQKIEQELRAQGQQEKQQAGTQKPDQLKTTAQQMGIKTPNLPTRSQQTTVSGNTPSGSSYRAPVKGQSTQNQPQKERSFGSTLYANRPDAARAASQMRRGYTGESGKDIRYTKPTQTNFPTTQQQNQTTTPQPQQSTSSLAQRKQTVTNKPQSPQNTELTKPTREIQREINPEPTAGQPPQGSRPEAFARPQKPQPKQVQQPQTQQSNNKSLQQRKRFSAPSSKKVIPGSSNLGALSKVVKRVDPSGYGDN